MSNTNSKVMEYHFSKLTPEHIENLEFFKRKLKENTFAFSPSSLKKLIDTPMLFFKEHVCDDIENKTTAGTERGTLVHTLLLEPDEFEKRYAILPENMQAPTDRMLTLITKVLELGGDSSVLHDYKQDILDLMVLDNYHQTLADDKKNVALTGDFKRLEKVLTEENVTYFMVMHQNIGKKIITQNMKDEAQLKADVIGLIQGSENFQIENDLQDIAFELDLFATIPEFKYPVHAIIDCLKIDTEKKKLIITDLKTTGSSLEAVIKWDIEKYRYGIQAAINFICVKEFAKSEAVLADIPNIGEFEVEFNFAFIDSNNSGYVLPVSHPTMEKYILETCNYLNEIAHEHLELFDFSAPLQFLKNNVIL